jgi:hypothetical protein
MYLKAPNVKSHFFSFSIIIQTMQLFDCFHEKLHEVSSSSKLESCLRVQKPGAQPRGHNFFKAAHVSNLKKCLFYSIFYALDVGTGLGKGTFLQTSTNI